jgi:hypothetical protein|uniref:Uncharacterized protein n=1 Tax=viral metagenome TaxID=1070528 RepID=A0A6C0B244_9ZZZZ
MMPHGLLLEYMGTLLITASLFFTHANPIVVGLAYMSALFIADGKSDGFFTPLGVLVQHMLGRIGSTASLKLLVAQAAGAFSVVLLYKGRRLTGH